VKVLCEEKVTKHSTNLDCYTVSVPIAEEGFQEKARQYLKEEYAMYG
jgi:hypothetical protein